MNLIKKINVSLAVFFVILILIGLYVFLFPIRNNKVLYTIDTVRQHQVSGGLDIYYPAIKISAQGVSSDELAISSDSINRAIRDEITNIIATSSPHRAGIFDELVVDFEQIPAFVPEHAVFSISFNVFLNGTKVAHPDNYIDTISFNVRDGSRVFLTDIFSKDSSYLERLSRLTKERLSVIAIEREISPDSLDSEGFGPKGKNFSVFTIGTDYINFVFNPYQIGPRTLGVLTIKIPFSDLVGFIDPRFLRK